MSSPSHFSLSHKHSSEVEYAAPKCDPSRTIDELNFMWRSGQMINTCVDISKTEIKTGEAKNCQKLSKYLFALGRVVVEFDVSVRFRFHHQYIIVQIHHEPS